MRASERSGEVAAASQQWPLLGMAAPLLWFSLVAFLTPGSYGFCSAGCALGLAGAVVAARVSPDAVTLLADAPGQIALTLAAALPSLSLLCILPSAVEALLWLLGGAGASLSCANWFVLLCRQKITWAVGFLIGSWLLATLVHLALNGLLAINEPARGILLTAAPVCSVVFERIAVRIPRSDTSLKEPLPSLGHGFYAGAVAIMLGVALFFGVSHAFPFGILDNPQAAFSASLCFDVLLCLLIAFWMASSVFRRLPETAFPPVLLVVLFALLIAMFVFRANLFFLLGVLLSARTLVMLCLSLMALSLVKRGSYAPLFCYCVIIGLYRAGLVAGLLLSDTDFMHAFFEFLPHEGIYLLSACAAVLVVYLLLIASGFFREARHSRIATATVVLETSFIDARCAEVGATFGLKEREIEIAKLLCHGRTRKYIAEALYLSENTVKWYCRQIYQKLGIHKKQELLSLVGVSDDAG